MLAGRPLRRHRTLDAEFRRNWCGRTVPVPPPGRYDLAPMKPTLPRALVLVLLLAPLAGCRDEAPKPGEAAKSGRESTDQDGGGRRRGRAGRRGGGGARKAGVDLCLFRDGRWLCDPKHDGPPAEIRQTFGKKGDLPLLADADGDGKDDPCVWRAGELLCDAGWNGEPAEATWRLGAAGDQPLMGQVAAGGPEEPCTFRDGEFRCLLPDGKQLRHRFGRKGDVAVLGDVDGDGRDDACVFREGSILCDTGGDGGEPEVTLPVGTREGRPLLGDVDGDGKDDACVQGPNAVTCMPQGAGKRNRVALRFAGLKESVALLGEVGDR